MLELGLNERGRLELGLNERGRLGLGTDECGTLRAEEKLAGLGLELGVDERGTLRVEEKLAGLGAGLGVRELFGGVKLGGAPVAGCVRKRDGSSPRDAAWGARNRAAWAADGT